MVWCSCNSLSNTNDDSSCIPNVLLVEWFLRCSRSHDRWDYTCNYLSILSFSMGDSIHLLFVPIFICISRFWNSISKERNRWKPNLRWSLWSKHERSQTNAQRNLLFLSWEICVHYVNNNMVFNNKQLLHIFLVRP